MFCYQPVRRKASQSRSLQPALQSFMIFCAAHAHPSIMRCRYEQQCQLLGLPASSLQWAWLQPQEQHRGSPPVLQAVEHCQVLEVRYHAFYSEEVRP